jgi:hypothetical protein
MGRRLGRTRLDGVDGCVGEGAHGAGYKPNDHVLVRRQLRDVLELDRYFLDLLVRREIRAFVTAVSRAVPLDHSRAHTPWFVACRSAVSDTPR